MQQYQYHTMYLNGEKREGIFDFSPYWDKFCFPEMKGKRVLDVGAADGYFSFEFEKRGAEVLATDITSKLDLDGPTAWSDNYLTPNKKILFCFSEIKEALKSKVEFKEINVYDLSPKEIGTFDIVFCGDVLLHLTDPIKAIYRMRQVCHGITIISTPVYDSYYEYLNWHSIRNRLQMAALWFLRNYPLALYRGARSGGAFWIPTKKCLIDFMVGCGFPDVAWIGSFKMDKEHAKVDVRSRGVIHGHAT